MSRKHVFTVTFLFCYTIKVTSSRLLRLLCNDTVNLEETERLGKKADNCALFDVNGDFK